MFTIVFYEDQEGHSEVLDWMRGLNARAERDKDARIQLDQKYYALKRAELDGTRAGEKFVKLIRDDIYELRPGGNRVMFFGWNGRYLVLLSHFPKLGQKTPRLEIEKAERLMKDWIRRKGR